MSGTLDRALFLYRTNRYDLAEQELRQVLGADPQNAAAHAVLGLCLAERLQFTEATRETQQAVGLAPDLPFAHHALAMVLFKRQILAEAHDAIREAIALDPHDAEHWALLANIRLEQRSWPGALEAAERGLTIDPQHVICNNLRAVALVKLGRRAEAGATIGSALARDPENAVTHANQGWALLHDGEPRSAMVHFREALRLDPQLEWARAGIVEAMKARNFIYRWMLLYFLWMARLSRRAQWGLIVGAYVGYQVLRGIANSSPDLAPWLWPVLIAYIVFVALTWLSTQLFTLVLRLDRFGRLVLSREQVLASNCVGGLLLATLTFLGVYLVTDHGPWSEAAFVSGFLIIPVSGLFTCSKGWPRWTMLAIIAGLAAIGISAVVVYFLLPRMDEPAQKPTLGLVNEALRLFTWGVVLASFAANGLAMARPRR